MVTEYFPHTRGTYMEHKQEKPQRRGGSQKALLAVPLKKQVTVVEASARHDSNNESTGTRGTADTISAGVTQLGLQRTKLSGAQRRRLRKEKKIAEGTWLEKKPQKVDHSKREGGAKKIAGPKRPRDESKSPPHAAKKPRSAGTAQTGNYSEVAAGFKMAVIDRRHPEVTVDQSQADLIQKKLLSALISTPFGSAGTVQFLRTTYSGGVLWMTCANEYTRNWLKETVPTLRDLWEGADLTVVESNSLPRRPRVLVLLPTVEGVSTEEAARQLLGRQNPDLRVGCWLLLNKKEGEGGVRLAYSIDEASFRTLRDNRFRAYFGLGSVVFRVLRGLDGGAKDSPSKPSTQ